MNDTERRVARDLTLAWVDRSGHAADPAAIASAYMTFARAVVTKAEPILPPADEEPEAEAETETEAEQMAAALPPSPFVDLATGKPVPMDKPQPHTPLRVRLLSAQGPTVYNLMGLPFHPRPRPDFTVRPCGETIDNREVL